MERQDRTGGTIAGQATVVAAVLLS